MMAKIHWSTRKNGLPIARFGGLSEPTAYQGETALCSLKPGSILGHSKDRTAVAESWRDDKKRTRVLLCAGCLATVRAYHRATALGHEPASDRTLKALALVWQAGPGGYELPVMRAGGGFAPRAEMVSALNRSVTDGVLIKVGARYRMAPL